MVSFEAQTLFYNFYEIQLMYFFLIAFHAFLVILRNCCLIKGHDDLFPFPSESFIPLGLIFKSIIHFELIFICRLKKESSIMLLPLYILLFQHNFLKRLLFSIDLTWYSPWKSTGHQCKGLFLDSCFHSIYMSILLIILPSSQ